MSPSSRFWADLPSREFAALDLHRAVAVLPLGATEQHGPHLPLSVDSCLVDGIVSVALPRLPADAPVLVLPTQQIGYSTEHSSFAGTLTLSPQTVIALWTEIGESVARAGLRKMLLFNAHGGHVSVMDVVGRELRTRCGLMVYSCSWWNLPLGEAVTGQFSAAEHRFGVHAGQQETAMMRALAPQRVDMAQAQDFHSASQDRAARFPILGNGVTAKLGWHIEDYNPAGAAGNAAAATPEQGQRLIDAAGTQLALLLQELVSLPPPAPPPGPPERP